MVININLMVKKFTQKLKGPTAILKPTGAAIHTAPESVKRVKSIKQILVKNKMEAERLSQC